MRELVSSLCDSVPVGQSKRFDCPACGGHNTLSVKNDMGKLKYLCFKASCDLRAGVAQGYVSSEFVKGRLNTPRLASSRFVMPDYFIQGVGNAECSEILRKYHCLEAYEKGLFKIGYDPRQNRFVFFVQDGNGSIVGAVGRKLDPYGAKVINYEGSGTRPFICGTGSTLVLVEDCFSAASVTRKSDYSGMALLGTNLKKEYIEYMLEYQEVVVALDADAKTKAIKIKNDLTYFHPNVKLRFLEEDIKEMATEDL